MKLAEATLIKQPASRPTVPLAKVSKYNPENWNIKGECFEMDLEWFFPVGQIIGDGETAQQAQAALSACNRCPVRKQCAQSVLDSLETDYPIRHGIWAGVRFTDTHNDPANGKVITAVNRREAVYERIRAIAEGTSDE